MAFLDQNLFLKKVAPELELSFNPLLLARRALYENIHILRTRFGRKGAEGGLDYLKGRSEQVSEAIVAGSLVKKPGTVTTNPVNTPCLLTLSTHHFYLPCQHNTSTNPVNTTYLLTLSTHIIHTS